MQIVFTDPPPGPRRRGASKHPWYDIAEQLKARPGEWALCLRDMHDSAASAIRLGKLGAFPLGQFDARAVRPTDRHQDVVTTSKDGRKQPIFDLYIRYVGHETAETSAPNDGKGV